MAYRKGWRHTALKYPTTLAKLQNYLSFASGNDKAEIAFLVHKPGFSEKEQVTSNIVDARGKSTRLFTITLLIQPDSGRPWLSASIPRIETDQPDNKSLF